MPRNYNNTVIYKIVCKDLNVKECYIGSTIEFIKRKSQHKIKSKFHHYKIYEFIRDNGGWDNFDMIEIEKFPCKDGNEARCRERYWYDLLNSTLNTIKPIITEDRVEYKKQSDKEYQEKNKEYIRKQRKEFRENNKERLSLVKKEYYEKNKERDKEKFKEYYKKNIEKVKEYREEKHLCECGAYYTTLHKNRHLATKKHIDLVNNKI
jgi:hypothetical protein